MENFLDELKNYFETTPREEILKAWEESKEFDKIGPTMDEFIENNEKYIKQNEE